MIPCHGSRLLPLIFNVAGRHAHCAQAEASSLEMEETEVAPGLKLLKVRAACDLRGMLQRCCNRGGGGAVVCMQRRLRHSMLGACTHGCVCGAPTNVHTQGRVSAEDAAAALQDERVSSNDLIPGTYEGKAAGAPGCYLISPHECPLHVAHARHMCTLCAAVALLDT